MLLKARFKKRSGEYERVFNVHNIIYIDPSGVLFAEGVHAVLVDGEYERLVSILQEVNGEGEIGEFL